MESRVNRYQKDYENDNLRSKKNKEIYEKIYENKDYNTVEKNIVKAKSNELNLDKLREILKDDTKDQVHIVKRETEIDIPDMQLEEEKVYDLKDILSRAKDNKDDEPPKLRSLNNTEYDILKGIDIKATSNRGSQEDELKKMINTVTNTSVINKMGDKELSLNLLKDLEGTKTLDEVKEELDTSFYTSSLGLTSNDFEQLKDINTKIKKDNKIIKALLLIILLFMIAATIFILLKFI